jgi:hypothetical protein
LGINRKCVRINYYTTFNGNIGSFDNSERED